MAAALMGRASTAQMPQLSAVQVALRCRALWPVLSAPALLQERLPLVELPALEVRAELEVLLQAVAG